MAELKAAYRISELARMVGVTRHTMRRWVLGRVPTERAGHGILVPLTAFKAAFPEVWESIILKAQYAEVREGPTLT